MKRFALASFALKTVAASLRQRKCWIIATVLVAILLLPQPSQGQFGFFGVIAGAISNVIGVGLDAVTEIMGAIEGFQRTVVWPEDLIDEARAAVGGVRAIFRDIQAIGDVAVASATLPAPGQLERTLLSGNPATIPQVSAQYADVYLTVPLAEDASPEVRNLIDMTDAVAQAAMKRAIAIDAIADLELEAADRILAEIETAAPGSAPILEAGASAWLVRANAHTQAALSELMRLRAIDLANAGAEMKIDVEQGRNLRENLNDALQRR
jgi:hypothetical protein